MRKSRFSDEQMVAILREADRTSVAETAKKHKVSDQTIYAWRKHFGALSEGPCGWAKSTGSSLTTRCLPSGVNCMSSGPLKPRIAKDDVSVGRCGVSGSVAATQPCNPARTRPSNRARRVMGCRATKRSVFECPVRNELLIMNAACPRKVKEVSWAVG